MSEMADWYLDQEMNANPDDWLGSGHRSPRGQSIVECRMCGKGGLHWEETDEGWRLAGHNGLLHKCDPARAQRAVLNDFDDVSGT